MRVSVGISRLLSCQGHYVLRPSGESEDTELAASLSPESDQPKFQLGTEPPSQTTQAGFGQVKGHLSYRSLATEVPRAVVLHSKLFGLF